MTHTVTLIPGDGIGPDVMAATSRLLAAVGADIEWDRHDAGVAALERHGEVLPDALERVIGRGIARTADIGNSASTTEFTDAVLRELE